MILEREPPGDRCSTGPRRIHADRVIRGSPDREEWIFARYEADERAVSKEKPRRRCATVLPVMLLGLLLYGALVETAAAHQIPGGCTQNLLTFSFTRDQDQIVDPDTVTYTVFVANNINPFTGCDVNATISFTCPGPDGTPSGTTTVLATNAAFTSDGSTDTSYMVPCFVDVNPGVTQATASATATGVVHDSASDSGFTISQNAGVVTVDQPGCPTISLSPSTLPNGTVGVFYDQTITASGGVEPYSFAVTSGSLPPGLVLSFNGDSALADLSGTPTTAGTFAFTITATDSDNCSGSQAYTVTITCPTITVSPTTLSDGAVGASYNQTLTASGGTAPYVFAVTSGSLPPGLTLSTGGVLSGSPTAGGSFSFTVTATDQNQCAGSRSYTVSIAGCGTITVGPSALFEGFVGVEYRRTLSGSGGTAPYSFSVTSGSLPPGLSFSGGAISGIPTATGRYTFEVQAVDSDGCSGSRTYTLTISCRPVTFSPPILPPASQGVAYNQTITVLGSPGPYTFSVTAGSLPSGLTLLPSGAFSGAPAGLGTFAFTVTATDATGCPAVQSYTLTVCAALTLSPATLPGATVLVLYSQTIAATGGTGPYVFAATGLPSSLTLDPVSGVLSGTPAAPGAFPVTVTATDVNGCPGTRSYLLRVCPVVAVSPGSLPAGTVGTGYSQTLVGSGGTGPYTFAASGSLPPGVTLSSAGVLSGTPTRSGTFAFTVTATDVSGCSAAPQSYTVRVAEASCTPPTAPLNPRIEPRDNATGPVTGTDYLRVLWDAPTSGPPPGGYEYSINGDRYTATTLTSVCCLDPRGDRVPIRLHVRAMCNPDVSGPEALSPEYSLAPPGADFTFPEPVRVGIAVTFTDRSDPQATSWLWVVDDVAASTAHSFMHTFMTAGTHRVALIASNGSGAGLKVKDVPVSASSASGAAVPAAMWVFETSDGLRWALPEIAISADERAWLEITSAQTEEVIVYLRFLDSDGRLALERRLSVSREIALYDVSAYGLEGVYTLELVSRHPIGATLAQPAEPFGREVPRLESRRPDEKR